MLIEKNINLSSNYSVDGIQVAMFNGSIGSDGTVIDVNRSIIDRNVYMKNRSKVNTAFNLFEDEVITIAQAVKESGVLA